MVARVSGKLTRSLGLRHVFALSTGAMLSSGLFLLPGLAATKSGDAAQALAIGGATVAGWELGLVSRGAGGGG